MKLNPKQLRQLIEGIINEKFGAFDASDRMTFDGETDTMMPHNFEAATEATFAIFTDKLADAFVETHMDLITNGFAPEFHEDYRSDLEERAVELKHQIMDLVEQFSNDFVATL